MRAVRTALCLWGFLAVSEWGQVPNPPAPPADPPAAVMASTPEEAGGATANLWRKRHPELLGGRVALGWDVRVPAAAAAAKGVAQADSTLRPLPDLGVVAESLGEALDQVDPQTFSGVLWLEVLMAENGDVTGISLTHRAPGHHGEIRMGVVLDPPIRPPSTPLTPTPPPAASPAEVLLRLKGAVCTAALSEDGEELWYTSAGHLVRYSLARGEQLQEWPPSGEDGSGSGCFLRLPSQGDGAGKAGWSSGGHGVWLALQGQEYRVGANFEGFPLTERESKFLKAPWLPDEGAFSLQDHQGKDLERFSGLVRIRAEGGESLLVLLRKDGSLRALHGNSLQPLPAPVEGTFAVLAGWRDLVAVAESEAPYRIRVMRAGDGGSWVEVWTSGPLSGRASALSLGRLKTRISALAFVTDGAGTEALLLPVP